MTRSSSSTACWSRPRARRRRPAGPSPEAHADREQGLDGAVVQVLGDPLAVLEHGQALQLTWRGVLEGDRGLLGEGLDQLHVGLAEQRAAAGGVGHRERAEGAAAHRGTNTAGPGPGGHDRALRGSAPASARTTALPVRMTSPVTEPSAGKTAPSSWPASSPSASTARRFSSVGRARVARSAPASAPGRRHHQPEQSGGVGPGQDGGADGPDGLQPLGAVLGLLVQVGVLDGRAGLGGQQGQGPLVVGVEVLPPSFSVR